MSAMNENGIEKPRAGNSVDFDSGSGPELRDDNVSDFLQWAGGVPVGAKDAIRERIGTARGNATILDRLLEELWTLPVRDAGRHYLLLSTLGELGDSRSVGELARFIWESNERISPVPHEMQNDGCGFGLHTADLLKARAVEMVAYIQTPEAIEETLRIVADHPAPAVRAAAIDAHLFNHGDAPEEMERMRSRARSGDAALIGLPRFTRDTTRTEFSRQIEDFYSRHPDRRSRPERDAPGPADTRGGE